MDIDHIDGDEELPGSDRPPPSRRTRLALGIATAALVVAGGVVLVTKGTGGSDPAKPTPVAETSPGLPLPPTPAGAAPCLDIGTSPLYCLESTTLPPAFLLAARTVLPRATVRKSVTVIGRSGDVYTRQVTVGDPGGTTLRVHVGPTNGRYSVISVPSTTSPIMLQLDIDVRTHHLTVTYRAADGQVPPVAALRRLAEDPRLISR